MSTHRKEIARRSCKPVGVVIVYTDNKGVYDRWHRGPKTSHDGNGALWDVIWDSYNTIKSRGGEIQLRKVVSHAEEKGVVAEGFLKDRNYFIATKILAKHDENYMPPEVKKAIGDK